MRGVGVTLVALTPFCMTSCAGGRNGEVEEACVLRFRLLGDCPITISSAVAGLRASPPFEAISCGDSVCRLPADTVTLRVLKVGDKKAYFIAEAGELQVNVENLEMVGGTLNSRKRKFEATLSDLRRRAAARYDTIARSSRLSPDDLRAELGLLVVRENRNIVRYVMSVVCANRANALGKYAFWVGVAQNRSIDSEEYKKLLDEAGEKIAKFEPIQVVTKRIERAAATSAGCPVADVLLVNSKGESESLAEHTGRGLTIVHVFDPYDERTPHTIRQLEWLMAKYGKSSHHVSIHLPLNLISISEYAKVDIVNRIVSRFGLSWVMFADPEGNFCREYGVDDLPFLLIVQDGKILERGVGGEALPLWVSAYVNEYSEN